MNIEFWADEFREEGLTLIPLDELCEKFDAERELLTDVDAERIVVEFETDNIKFVSINDRTTTVFGSVATVIGLYDGTEIVFGSYKAPWDFDGEHKEFVYATNRETFRNKIIPDEEVYLSADNTTGMIPPERQP